MCCLCDLVTLEMSWKRPKLSACLTLDVLPTLGGVECLRTASIRFVRCWGFECISVCRHSTSQSHRIDNFHETSFQPILNFFGPFNQRLASIFRISDKIRPPAMWLFILGHARYQMTNKKDLTTTHVISYTPPSDDDDDDDNVDGLFGWRRRL